VKGQWLREYAKKPRALLGEGYIAEQSGGEKLAVEEPEKPDSRVTNGTTLYEKKRNAHRVQCWIDLRLASTRK